MKIFEKRPLSLILCIMLGGFSLFSLSDIKIKLLALTFGIFILGISFIHGVFTLSKIRLIKTAAVCFILSILLSITWQNHFFPNELHNGTFEIEAEVIEVQNKKAIRH